MRTEHSVKNAISAVVANSVRILMGFIFQKVFLMQLGVEYLGLNGLLGNVISMISIAELGIGTAIIYNLYKPISENNIEKVKSLVHFYKRCYQMIILIICSLSIVFLFFLPYVVGETTITNIWIYYFLFLFDSMLTYSVAHLSSLLCANQENHIVNNIEAIYLLGMNIIQIVFLFLTKSYLLFALIKVASRIAQNIAIHHYAYKKYPYLKEKNIEPLEKNVLQDIKKKVKAMILHKFSTFVVVSTDNIIITKFLGLVVTGLYSNYKLIINSVGNLFLQIFSSITSSVGNLLINKDKQKSYEVYRKLLLLNFWIFGFSSVAIYYMIDPFIATIYGGEYLLSNAVLITLVIYFYLHGMRGCIGAFKEADGIYYEDRFMPVVESIVNIVFSIIFVKIWGLAGVFLGTIFSVLVLHLYSYPKYSYQKIFDRKPILYIKEQLFYFFIAFASVLLTGIPVYLVHFNHVFAQFCWNTLMCLIIPNIFYFFIFYRTKEFQSLFQIFKQFVNKIVKKKEN